MKKSVIKRISVFRKATEWWGAGVVVCLERGADLHMAQMTPLPLTVSRFSKIQIGFTFLVPAYLGSPGKRAVKRVCATEHERLCPQPYWIHPAPAESLSVCPVCSARYALPAFGKYHNKCKLNSLEHGVRCQVTHVQTAKIILWLVAWRIIMNRVIGTVN